MPVEAAAPEPARPGSRAPGAGSPPVLRSCPFWARHVTVTFLCGFLVSVGSPCLCSPWHAPEHVPERGRTAPSCRGGAPRSRALTQGLSRPSLSASLPPFLLSVPPTFSGDCLSWSPSEPNHFLVESAGEFLKLCLSRIIFDARSLRHPRGCCDAGVGFSLSLWGWFSGRPNNPLCSPEPPWPPLTP